MTKRFLFYLIFLFSLFNFILFNILNNGFLLKLDLFVNLFIEKIINDTLFLFFLFITFFGSGYFIFFSSLILILYFLHKNDHLRANFIIILISTTSILIGLLKILILRARPENLVIDTISFSFPSGHTTLSFVFFLMIIYLFKDKFKFNYQKNLFIYFSYLMIFLIGISRIFLSVHWTTDVLAGWILGSFIYLIIYKLKQSFIK